MTDSSSHNDIDALAASESGRQSISTRIIESLGEYEVFTTPSGDAILSVTLNGKMENYPIESAEMVKLLRIQYKRGRNKIANDKNIKEAVGIVNYR